MIRLFPDDDEKIAEVVDEVHADEVGQGQDDFRFDIAKRMCLSLEALDKPVEAKSKH